MGLWDKLNGTKYPGGDIAPRPAVDVQAALLALNRPDLPYVVRDGAAEGADLVAEWRLTEPAWQAFFANRQLSRRIRIRMRLVPADHEVRVVQEHWKVNWVGGVPVSKEYGRGPVKTTSQRWTVGRGEEGGLEVAETFRFDSAELTDPLQNTVLAAGWTWRGVVFGKL